MDAHLVRRKKTPPAPCLKVSKKGGITRIAADHPEPAIGHLLLMEELGTTEADSLDGLLGQLANAAGQGQKVDEHGLNFMLSVVKGVEPNDQVEAMLAAQMAAVHMATMTFARRLAHVDNITQQDSAERAFNKLVRTFTTQVEALKRYRTGGEQKVTVEHVTVNEGGQAIVGNVSHRGRGSRKNGSQPHETRVRLPEGDALLGHLEANGATMQGTRRKGLGRMPLSRRAWRGTGGQPQRQISARALHEGGGGRTPSSPGASPAIPRGDQQQTLVFHTFNVLQCPLYTQKQTLLSSTQNVCL